MDWWIAWRIADMTSQREYQAALSLGHSRISALHAKKDAYCTTMAMLGRDSAGTFDELDAPEARETSHV